MGSSVLKQTSAWLLFLLVIAMLPLLAPAQVSAPSPGPDCSTSLISLLPCLDFVQGNVSTPPKNCCDALAGIVSATPICLCTLFAGNNSYGIPINVTDALMLPSLCKVTTPPASECSAAGYPVPGSLAAPTVSPPALPPAPMSPTPTSGVPSVSPVPSSVISAPAPTTASPTLGSPGSSVPSGATPSGGTTPSPPSTLAPSPNAAGELSVSTAMCFVVLLVASLQIVKM